MTYERTPVLEVEDLTVSVNTPVGTADAVSGVSFTVDRSKILGIVGESGSGKTLSCLAVMGLLPKNAERQHGTIRLSGMDLVALSTRQIRTVRGSRMGMVFQDYSEALNPVRTIGNQIAEPLELYKKLSGAAARRRGLELLELVGIPDPAVRWREYPHQLSGGMAQRVMIAMSLACEPELIIADEPTTALDVTIQAQILDLLIRMRDETGTAMIIVSHDLGVVAETADSVAVMYAGRIVEEGDVFEVFERPRHRYTAALLASQPRFDGSRKELVAIPGRVPPITEYPGGCAFASRCTGVQNDCTLRQPPISSFGSSHRVACLNPMEIG